ncbi:MAG: hypothetical protein MRZ97_07635 [Firmicutes bacterium]|nr:hypothetical protein [Bacillota bacterium]
MSLIERSIESIEFFESIVSFGRSMPQFFPPGQGTVPPGPGTVPPAPNPGL